MSQIQQELWRLRSLSSLSLEKGASPRVTWDVQVHFSGMRVGESGRGLEGAHVMPTQGRLHEMPHPYGATVSPRSVQKDAG